MSCNALTDRQKEIDRAIDNFGVKLNSSIKCLIKLMLFFGAKRSETDYVKELIVLRLKTQTVLNDTDDFISRTEAMLNKIKIDI